jgi:hypothetical protein
MEQVRSLVNVSPLRLALEAREQHGDGGTPLKREGLQLPTGPQIVHASR